MPHSLAYMMLSRSESVEDLFIAGRFDPAKIRCDPKALEEVQRLAKISLTNKPATQNLDYLLKFGFVNIRSINKNLEHLAIDQIMLQYEIILVTETWKD